MGRATEIIEQKRAAFTEYLEEVVSASQDVLDALHLAKGGEGDCPAKVVAKKFDISSDERVSFEIESVQQGFDSFIEVVFPNKSEAFSGVVRRGETIYSSVGYFLSELNKIAEANNVPTIDPDIDLSPNPNTTVSASSPAILLAARRTRVLEKFSNDIADAVIAQLIENGELHAEDLSEDKMNEFRAEFSLHKERGSADFVFEISKGSRLSKSFGRLANAFARHSQETSSIKGSLEQIATTLNSFVDEEYQVSKDKIPELPVAPSRVRGE